MNTMWSWVLIGVLWGGVAVGQDAEDPVDETEAPEDPFADAGVARGGSPKISEGRAGRETASLLIRLDIYEVPTGVVMELLDEWQVEDGMGAVRTEIQSTVAKGQGKVIDTLAVTSDAGLKVRNESILEQIYPTEYEPPSMVELPFQDKAEEELTPLQKLMIDVNTIASPTAFETRNSGTTLEVEVRTVSEEDECWDVSYAVELVSLQNVAEWRNAIKMPIFSSTRCAGSFRVKDGAWVLASCQGVMDEAGQPLEGLKRLTFLRVKRIR